MSNKKATLGSMLSKKAYCARKKKKHNLNLKLIVQLFQEWNGRNEAAKDCSTQHSCGIYFSKVHVVATEPETSVNYSVTSHTLQFIYKKSFIRNSRLEFLKS